MTKTAHTKGPWTVGPLSSGIWATDDKGNFPVCDIRGWGHLTGRGHGALGLSFERAKAIQAANAQLIAAAPELLEALKIARECIAYCRRAHKDVQSGTGIPVEYILDAAIAKAEVGGT